jgi:hypothetical protein
MQLSAFMSAVCIDKNRTLPSAKPFYDGLREVLFLPGCLCLIPRPMQSTRLCLILAFVLVCGRTSFADTIMLKNGDKVEGKVVSETGTDVTVEVQVSAGILDSRVISKTDIASVTKAQPDAAAWEPLKNMKLGASSMAATAYDAMLNPLRSFTTQFQTSTHASDAQKLIADIEAEKKRVAAGEVKLNGKWMTKEEAQKERYQINALLAFQYMRDQGGKGDLVAAMNAFDVIETQYPGAKVYPDAVELARRILPGLKQDIERKRQTWVPEIEQRRRQIDTMPSGPQRNELITQQQREDAATDAAIQNAERQRLKWMPVNFRSERLLSLNLSRIPDEIQRLNGLDVAKMRQSIKLAEDAREAFGRKEYDVAETNLREAIDLWFANELATRLQTEHAQAKLAMQSTDSPPTVEPGTTPVPGEPGAAAPGTSTTPAAGSPPATGAAASTNVTTTASSEPADGGDAGEEPQKPFLLRPIGAITVILLVAFVSLVVSTYKKIRGRANEALE